MNGVVRVPVGRGTHEGMNSAYLLPEAGVVVDPGPPTDEAWTSLRQGVADAGLSLDAIEHVLVTHWHSDHAGLACRLGDAADASVHLHADDAPLVGDYRTERGRRLERDAEALRRWGVPESTLTDQRDADGQSPMPDTYDVRARTDGDTVAGVEFLHTPGHTAGHASLVYGETVLLGDLLLPTYTPNVGGSDTRMTDPLGAYLRSIRRIDARFDRGEPGHGTTMTIGTAVDENRAHHRERAQAAFRTVAAADEATPWTVARDLFGEMRGIHVKFGAGEAAAHLRRLEACDVVERLDGTPVRYRPEVDDYPAGLNLTP